MLCCLLAPDWIEDDGSQLLFYTSLLLPPLQLERQWPWMQRSYETMYGRLTSYLTKRLHIVGACNAILSTCSSFLQKVPFCPEIWNTHKKIPEKIEQSKGASAFVFAHISLQFHVFWGSCKTKLKVRGPIFTLRLLAICFARVTFANLSADYSFVCRKPRENIATY